MASRASPDLQLICDFVNGRGLAGDPDGLQTSTARADAFNARDTLLGTIPAAEQGRVDDFREALRRVLETNNGQPPDPAAIADLNRLAAAASLRMTLGEDSTPRLEPAGTGVDRALATLCAAMLVAAQNGEWPRLKACRDDGCGWVFYDTSKNGSRTWCTMRLCGSRAKMRAYRARRRQESTVAQG